MAAHLTANGTIRVEVSVCADPNKKDQNFIKVNGVKQEFIQSQGINYVVVISKKTGKVWDKFRATRSSMHDKNKDEVKSYSLKCAKIHSPYDIRIEFSKSYIYYLDLANLEKFYFYKNTGKYTKTFTSDEPSKHIKNTYESKIKVLESKRKESEAKILELNKQKKHLENSVEQNNIELKERKIFSTKMNKQIQGLKSQIRVLESQMEEDKQQHKDYSEILQQYNNQTPEQLSQKLSECQQHKKNLEDELDKINNLLNLNLLVDGYITCGYPRTNKKISDAERFLATLLQAKDEKYDVKVDFSFREDVEWPKEWNKNISNILKRAKKREMKSILDAFNQEFARDGIKLDVICYQDNRKIFSSNLKGATRKLSLYKNGDNYFAIRQTKDSNTVHALELLKSLYLGNGLFEQFCQLQIEQEIKLSIQQADIEDLANYIKLAKDNLQGIDTFSAFDNNKITNPVFAALFKRLASFENSGTDLTEQFANFKIKYFENLKLIINSELSNRATKNDNHSNLEKESDVNKASEIIKNMQKRIKESQARKEILELLNKFIDNLQAKLNQNGDFFKEHREKIRKKVLELKKSSESTCNKFNKLYDFLDNLSDLKKFKAIKTQFPEDKLFYEDCLSLVENSCKLPQFKFDENNKACILQGVNLSWNECKQALEKYCCDKLKIFNLKCEKNGKLTVINSENFKIQDLPLELVNLIQDSIELNYQSKLNSNREEPPRWSQSNAEGEEAKKIIEKLALDYDVVFSTLIEKVEIIAGNNLYIEDNIAFNGVDLTLFAHNQISLKEKCEINTSTRDALEYNQTQAHNGEDYRQNNTPKGDHGEHGLCGLNAKHAGHIHIEANKIINFEGLNCIANGGNGAKGQQGGNGDQGQTSNVSTVATADPFSGDRGGMRLAEARIPGVGPNGEDYQHEKSGPGGFAGKPGAGGTGGNPGHILIRFKDKEIEVKPNSQTKHERFSASPGKNGERGELASGGKAGEGGYKGLTHWISYQSYYKKKLTFLSALFFSKARVCTHKNVDHGRKNYDIEYFKRKFSAKQNYKSSENYLNQYETHWYITSGDLKELEEPKTKTRSTDARSLGIDRSQQQEHEVQVKNHREKITQRISPFENEKHRKTTWQLAYKLKLNIADQVKERNNKELQKLSQIIANSQQEKAHQIQQVKAKLAGIKLKKTTQQQTRIRYKVSNNKKSEPKKAAPQYYKPKQKCAKSKNLKSPDKILKQINKLYKKASAYELLKKISKGESFTHKDIEAFQRLSAWYASQTTLSIESMANIWGRLVNMYDKVHSTNVNNIPVLYNELCEAIDALCRKSLINRLGKFADIINVTEKLDKLFYLESQNIAENNKAAIKFKQHFYIELQSHMPLGKRNRVKRKRTLAMVINKFPPSYYYKDNESIKKQLVNIFKVLRKKYKAKDSSDKLYFDLCYYIINKISGFASKESTDKQDLDNLFETINEILFKANITFPSTYPPGHMISRLIKFLTAQYLELLPEKIKNENLSPDTIVDVVYKYFQSFTKLFTSEEQAFNQVKKLILNKIEQEVFKNKQWGEALKKLANTNNISDKERTQRQKLFLLCLQYDYNLHNKTQNIEDAVIALQKEAPKDMSHDNWRSLQEFLNQITQLSNDLQYQKIAQSIKQINGDHEVFLSNVKAILQYVSYTANSKPTCHSITEAILKQLRQPMNNMVDPLEFISKYIKLFGFNDNKFSITISTSLDKLLPENEKMSEQTHLGIKQKFSKLIMLPYNALSDKELAEITTKILKIKDKLIKLKDSPCKSTFDFYFNTITERVINCYHAKISQIKHESTFNIEQITQLTQHDPAGVLISLSKLLPKLKANYSPLDAADKPRLVGKGKSAKLKAGDLDNTLNDIVKDYYKKPQLEFVARIKSCIDKAKNYISLSDEQILKNNQELKFLDAHLQFYSEKNKLMQDFIIDLIGFSSSEKMPMYLFDFLILQLLRACITKLKQINVSDSLKAHLHNYFLNLTEAKKAKPSEALAKLKYINEILQEPSPEEVDEKIFFNMLIKDKKSYKLIFRSYEKIYFDKLPEEKIYSIIQKYEASKWLKQIKLYYWQELLCKKLFKVEDKNIGEHKKLLEKFISCDSWAELTRTYVDLEHKLNLNNDDNESLKTQLQNIYNLKKSIIISYSSVLNEHEHINWLKLMDKLLAWGESKILSLAAIDKILECSNQFDSIAEFLAIIDKCPDDKLLFKIYNALIIQAINKNNISGSDHEIAECQRKINMKLNDNIFSSSNGLILLEYLVEIFKANSDSNLPLISTSKFNLLLSDLIGVKGYNDPGLIAQLKGLQLSGWELILNRRKIALKIKISDDANGWDLIDKIIALQKARPSQVQRLLERLSKLTPAINQNILIQLINKFDSYEWELSNKVCKILEEKPGNTWLIELKKYHAELLKIQNAPRAAAKLAELMGEESGIINDGIKDLLTTSEKKPSRIITMTEEINKLYLAKYKDLAENTLKNKIKDLFNDNHFLRYIDDQNKNDQNIIEYLAVIKAAIFKISGMELYDTQLIALICFLNSFNKPKGLLANINTGEGKTMVTIITAITRALMGEIVDIVTSSSELAKRDALKAAKYCKWFEIGVSNICDEKLTENDESRKDSYQQNKIIYGDAGSFQRDYLLDKYFNKNLRQNKPKSVIIDEVDSALIDNTGQVLYLSHEIHDLNNLRMVLINIWQLVNTQGLRHPSKKNMELVAKEIKNRMERKNSKLLLPPHLKDFSLRRLDTWIKNAYHALSMKNNDCYSTSEHGDYANIPLIINKDTGVEQTHSKWSLGLHQFLQLKHSSELTSESLRAMFVSNVSYFKEFAKTGCLYGMTGTLGDEEELKFLDKLYGVKTFKLPKLKQEKYRNEPAVVLGKDKEWFDKIIQDTYQKISSGPVVDDKAKQAVDKDVEKIIGKIKLKNQEIKNFIEQKAKLEKELEILDKTIKKLMKEIKNSTQETTKEERDEKQSKRNKNEKLQKIRQAELTKLCEKINEESLIRQKLIAQKQDFTSLKQGKNGRAVLVICENKEIAQKFYEYLQEDSKGHEKVNNIYKYDSSLEDFKLNTEHLQCGDIVIATNISGRGTDFEISKELEKAGGLHVTRTYIGKNSRVDDQAFGRAARNGKPGSGKYIVFDQRVTKNSPISINQLLNERDEQEKQRLQKIIKFKIPRINLEKELLNQFFNLQQGIESKLLGKKLEPGHIELQIKSLQNQWAFWLDEKDKELQQAHKYTAEEQKSPLLASFKEFSQKMEARLEDKEEFPQMLIVEPAELRKLGLYYIKHKKYHSARDVLDKAAKKDPKFAAFAHYYKAVARMGINSSSGTKKSTRQDLKKAYKLIDALWTRIEYFNHVDAVVRKSLRTSGQGMTVNMFEKHNKDELEVIKVHLGAIAEIMGSPLEEFHFKSAAIIEEERKVLYKNVCEHLKFVKGFRLSKKIITKEIDGKKSLYYKKDKEERKIIWDAKFKHLEKDLIENIFAKKIGKKSHGERRLTQQEFEDYFLTREKWRKLCEHQLEEVKFICQHENFAKNIEGETFWKDEVFKNQGLEIKKSIKQYKYPLKEADFKLSDEVKKKLIEKNILTTKTKYQFKEAARKILADKEKETDSLLQQLKIDTEKCAWLKTSIADTLKICFEKQIFELEDTQLKESAENDIQRLWASLHSKEAVRKPCIYSPNYFTDEDKIKDHVSSVEQDVRDNIVGLVAEAPSLNDLIKDDDSREDLIKTIASSITNTSGSLRSKPELKLVTKDLFALDYFKGSPPPAAVKYARLSCSGVISLIEVPPEPNFWGAFWCSMLGVAQIFVGTLICVFAPGLSHFGEALINEGINDIRYGINGMISGNFSWEAYREQKAISMLISFIGAGVASRVSGGVKEAGKKTFMKTFTKKLFKSITKVAADLAIDCAVNRAIEGLFDLMLKKLFKNLSELLVAEKLDNIKTEISDLIDTVGLDKAQTVMNEMLSNLDMQELLQASLPSNILGHINKLSSNLYSLSQTSFPVHDKEAFSKMAFYTNQISKICQKIEYINLKTSLFTVGKGLSSEIYEKISKLNNNYKKHTAKNENTNKDENSKRKTAEHFVEQIKNLVNNATINKAKEIINNGASKVAHQYTAPFIQRTAENFGNWASFDLPQEFQAQENNKTSDKNNKAKAKNSIVKDLPGDTKILTADGEKTFEQIKAENQGDKSRIVGKGKGGRYYMLKPNYSDNDAPKSWWKNCLYGFLDIFDITGISDAVWLFKDIRDLSKGYETNIIEGKFIEQDDEVFEISIPKRTRTSFMIPNSFMEVSSSEQIAQAALNGNLDFTGGLMKNNPTNLFSTPNSIPGIPGYINLTGDTETPSFIKPLYSTRFPSFKSFDEIDKTMEYRFILSPETLIDRLLPIRPLDNSYKYNIETANSQFINTLHGFKEIGAGIANLHSQALNILLEPVLRSLRDLSPETISNHNFKEIASGVARLHYQALNILLDPVLRPFRDLSPETISKIVNRSLGAAAIIGGGVEAGVGAFGVMTPEPITTVLGSVAILHGVDEITTGFDMLVSGKHHDTKTFKGLNYISQGLGFTPATSGVVAGGLELGISLMNPIKLGYFGFARKFDLLREQMKPGSDQYIRLVDAFATFKNGKLKVDVGMIKNIKPFDPNFSIYKLLSDIKKLAKHNNAYKLTVESQFINETLLNICKGKYKLASTRSVEELFATAKYHEFIIPGLKQSAFRNFMAKNTTQLTAATAANISLQNLTSVLTGSSNDYSDDSSQPTWSDATLNILKRTASNVWGGAKGVGNLFHDFTILAAPHQYSNYGNINFDKWYYNQLAIINSHAYKSASLRMKQRGQVIKHVSNELATFAEDVAWISYGTEPYAIMNDIHKHPRYMAASDRANKRVDTKIKYFRGNSWAKIYEDAGTTALTNMIFIGGAKSLKYMVGPKINYIDSITHNGVKYMGMELNGLVGYAPNHKTLKKMHRMFEQTEKYSRKIPELNSLMDFTKTEMSLVRSNPNLGVRVIGLDSSAIYEGVGSKYPSHWIEMSHSANIIEIAMNSSHYDKFNLFSVYKTQSRRNAGLFAHEAAHNVQELGNPFAVNMNSIKPRQLLDAINKDRKLNKYDFTFFKRDYSPMSRKLIIDLPRNCLKKDTTTRYLPYIHKEVGLYVAEKWGHYYEGLLLYGKKSANRIAPNTGKFAKEFWEGKPRKIWDINNK